MEGPGMSLFQGAGSIHINNSVQERLEEQEEIEDQKRRHEELKNKLDNGFDDLSDDEEASSVNTSANFTVDASQHPSNKGSIEGEPKRTCNLPSYVESLHHLKENQHDVAHPYCQTPKPHYHRGRLPDDSQKYCYSPYGAGDGQNINYCQQEYNKGHVNGVNSFEGRPDHQAIIDQERLKMMYEMCVKECQQLAMDKEEQRKQSDMEIDSLRVRLSAAMSDRDKAELSLQEAHHLLASSKQKMLEFEQQVHMLNEKLVTHEHDKEQLRLELRSSNISLQEAQKRLQSLQVTQSHNNDALFREQQDRHREEIYRLHEDLQKVKCRLEEKENEIKSLERRCKETEREKEELVVEKGGVINRLARELETAQALAAGGEAARLQERAAQLTAERAAAREQVKELGSKLEVTAHELVLCRSKLANCQQEYDDWRTTLQQVVHDTLSDTAYIGGLSSPGKLANLKDILSRYKQQAQKFAALQEELVKRDKKLEAHRKQESELRSKLEEQRGVEMQLTSRVAVLSNKLQLVGDGDQLETYRAQHAEMQAQMDALRDEYKALDLKYTELEMEYDKLKKEKGSRASIVQDANADLLRELERYSTQLKETLKENGELKNMYLKVCCEREAKSREIKEMENKLKLFQREKDTVTFKEAEYRDLVEKERQKGEKLAADLAAERGELDRANKRISQLQKEYTEKQKEFTDKLNKYIEEERSAVRKELEICTQCEKHAKNIKNLEEQLSQCHLKLATQASNEELMQELKSKADFFKNYILEKHQRHQDLRSVATNTEEQATDKPSCTHGVEDPPNHIDKAQEDALDARTKLMIKETEIRDQIAEKFTLEIKTVEMNCTKKLKEMENEHICNVNKLKMLLEKKVDEVETLKQFILSERTKITEILDAKENEISILIKENNSLQEEYQDIRERATEFKNSLEKAQAKISKLKTDIEKRSSDLSNEREKTVRSRCEMTQKVEVLEAKIAQIEAEHQLLKEKYKNVKRTAFTYKEYASKKDDHIENELERIKTHYKDIVTDLQNKIQILVNKREQTEATDRIHKIQSNFSAVMSDTNRPL